VPANKIDHVEPTEVLAEVSPQDVMEPLVDRIRALAGPGGVDLGDVVSGSQVRI
jgi:hypothetical protein